MERDPSTGRVIVTSIARDGLFANTELAVGDIVLSFNKRRFSDDCGDGIGSLENMVRKRSTICVAFKTPERKKQNHNSRNSIRNQSNSSNNKSSKRHRGKQRNGDMAQYNADGSLKFQKKGEGSSSSDDTDTTQGSTKTLTISASKLAQGSTLLQQHTSRSRYHRNSTNHSGQQQQQQNSEIGLKLAVSDRRLVVTDISSRSMFGNTELRPGDIVLSVNDMCFRKFPDADYAARIMNKANLLVTLVVERHVYDPENEWFEDSLSYFGNETHECHSSLTSGTETTTNVPIQPITISVPKSRRSEDAGLRFQMVRTKLNQTRESWICVEKIDRNSVFRNTSLRKGDKILCINDVDLRKNPDPRVASQACYDANEAIAMIVIKKEDKTRVSLG